MLEEQYREVRTMDMSDLRALCIRRGWYTGGNNEEYSRLLDMTKANNFTATTILKMTKDIVAHSHNADFDNVSYELFRISNSFFVKTAELQMDY